MITPSGSDPFVIAPPGWTPPGGGYAPPSSPSSPMAPPSGKGGCVGCSSKSSTNNFANSNSLQNSMHNIVQSWYDTPLQQPVDPRILIANTFLDSTAGTFARSSGFLAPTWGVSPLVLSGSAVCTTLHTDDLLAVAEAAQWTFAHQGLNLSVTNPPCLQKVAFLRGGTSYEMSFGIDFGAGNHSNVMLSFRDNAATPGDFTGSATIPVITFPAVYTGVKTFKVTLKQLGTFVMALRTTSAGTNYMFEMEWNVVQ